MPIFYPMTWLAPVFLFMITGCSGYKNTNPLILSGQEVPVELQNRATRSADTEIVDHCEKFSAFAKMTMDLRQKGAPMADLMKVVNGNAVHETLVMNAYETPLISSENGKKSVSASFRDRAFKDCFARMRAGHST